MAKVINLTDTPSLLSHIVSEIRDKEIQQDRMRFRWNLTRLGELMGYEISKQLNYKRLNVETPLGTAECDLLEAQPVLGTILRAGMPLHDGLLRCFDRADNAFIAAFRKPNSDKSFEIALRYFASPKIDGRVLVISDPMLASGRSFVKTLEQILDIGTPKETHLVTAIASEEGVSRVVDSFHDLTIWAGAIDPELNAKSYIIPGLGDAGDLAYGPKEY